MELRTTQARRLFRAWHVLLVRGAPRYAPRKNLFALHANLAASAQHWPPTALRIARGAKKGLFPSRWARRPVVRASRVPVVTPTLSRLVRTVYRVSQPRLRKMKAPPTVNHARWAVTPMIQHKRFAEHALVDFVRMQKVLSFARSARSAGLARAVQHNARLGLIATVTMRK